MHYIELSNVEQLYRLFFYNNIVILSTRNISQLLFFKYRKHIALLNGKKNLKYLPKRKNSPF